MSIRIMADIWENGPDSGTETLVLLALADYANDDGDCWPAIGSLVKKTRLSERGVQSVLRRLEANGWIEISHGGGRKNCNLYHINQTYPHSINPAAAAPRSSCTPQMDAETPQMDAINPAAAAPEPSRTIKEPSKLSKRAPDEVHSILCKVSGVNPDAVTSFIAYRKRHKSKALTETGANRLAVSLWGISDAGGDPTDALGMAEERGWATVQPDWYFNAKGNRNDNRNSSNQSSRIPQGGKRPDPALENIARLAGLI